MDRLDERESAASEFNDPSPGVNNKNRTKEPTMK